jgi:hypothetical protein
VSNFIGDGYVNSFYVPYYCQSCEKEKAMLVTMDELRGAGAIKAPVCRCDGCDGIMAFDDLEDSYFGFVRAARREVPPRHVREILERIAPVTAERKIISRAETGSSFFAGIPPTTTRAEDEFGTAVSSVVPPSAASLRRLRDKTGLRTLRQQSPEDSEEHGRRWGWAVALIAGVALAAAVGLTWALL